MSPGSKIKHSEKEWSRLATRKPYLWKRARMVQAIRCFFTGHGYLEVETLQLIPAPAPEVHIDAIRTGNLYLQTSPELCMKRLLASGYDKIFQISKCFRHGERGNLHLPEFTLLEWYRTGVDYKALMEECEELVLHVSRDLGSGEKIHYQGQKIDLQAPWEKITVAQAFERHASLCLEEAIQKERFDEIVAKEIEPKLGITSPTFLYDYPASLAALARLNADHPEFAERFELYLGGIELANAFSELTNAEEQRARFEKDLQRRQEIGKDAYPMPEKFLSALDNMSDAAGIALGIDRLAMLFADRATIGDVVPFTPEEV